MVQDEREQVPQVQPVPHGRVDHRQNNFDVLRFLMAVLVIWSHCYPLGINGLNNFEPLFRWTTGRSTFGSVAVDVFFIISGYLVTMSWQRSRSPWHYLKKRICRIYPGYVMATLLCAFVVAPLFVRPGMQWMNGELLWRLVKAMPQLHEYKFESVFADNPLPGTMSGSVWTIRYEFICYLLVLALGMSKLLRRRWGVVALFLIGLGLMFIQHVEGDNFGWITLHWPMFMTRLLGGVDDWPRFLTFYTAGMVYYLFRDEIPHRDWLAVLSVTALALGILFPPVFMTTLAVGGSYLVFWLAFQKHFALPNFARYGDFSYGIYLYGFPIQQILVATLGKRLCPWQLFALAAPLSILAGAVSWHVLEKRFLQKKAHWRTAGVPRPARTTWQLGRSAGAT
jgi:peptidoglycan/LPS O-acetylase OafA/YrhL